MDIIRVNKNIFLKCTIACHHAIKTYNITTMPLCNTHTHDTQHLFNCTHIRTTLSPLDLWTYPAGVMELLVRWEICWLVDQKRGNRTPPPPQTRVSGVGRHNNNRKGISALKYNMAYTTYRWNNQITKDPEITSSC